MQRAEGVIHAVDEAGDMRYCRKHGETATEKVQGGYACVHCGALTYPDQLRFLGAINPIARDMIATARKHNLIVAADLADDGKDCTLQVIFPISS